jgi:predicted neuraminidase
MLSEDDGRTWIGGLLLDDRDEVSYPDGMETADGRLYIIYDRERQRLKEIYFAEFTEADILAGVLGPRTRLRMLVNKADGTR